MGLANPSDSEEEADAEAYLPPHEVRGLVRQHLLAQRGRLPQARAGWGSGG